ncbi:Ger(x)C family spore germination C-terminal domain-containing protein [Cohnella xylanilytica]
MEDDIIRSVQMALERTQIEMKANIYNFADAFYRKYPREWSK